MAKRNNQYSRVYDSFQFDQKNEAYQCIEKKNNGEVCRTNITIGKWNPCSNLKRHLERCHDEVWKWVKLADEDESRLRSKKKKLASASQPTINSHFTPLSITISMNQEKFIRRIVKMVMSGVPSSIFESQGFFTLNGETAQKLGVSRESICKFVIEAANQMKDSLKNDLKGKLIFVKMDCATRQLRSFFGIDVQYYSERKKQTEIKRWLA